MKKILKTSFALVMATVTACCARVGFDNPVFYRPTRISATPAEKNVKDWQTVIAVNFSRGVTHNSRDGHEKKRQLLSLYGPVDLLALGMNVDDIAKMSKTNDNWKSGGALSKSFAARKDQDGMMDITGHFRIQEVDVSLQQTIFSGFFMQADLPIRDIRLDEIKYKRLGAKILGGIDLDDFIQETLAPILEENKFKLPTENGKKVLPSRFTKMRTPEVVLSLGWQGVGENILNYFEAIRGKLQLGAIVPMGTRKDEDLLIAMPVGYNNFFGVSMAAQGELKLWKYLVLGAQAGAKLFMRSQRNIRLKTSKDQQGIIALGKAMVSYDPGTIWNFTGYFKGEHLFRGLSVSAGYTFARQEETWIGVKDPNFLKDYVASQKPFGPSMKDLSLTGRFVSRDEIVNDDQRFKMWDMQTVHLMAEYDMQHDFKTMFAPCFGFSYDLPITGRRVFLPEMFSGSATLSCSWDF